MDVDVIKSLTNDQLSELFSEMSMTPNQKGSYENHQK